MLNGRGFIYDYVEILAERRVNLLLLLEGGLFDSWSILINRLGLIERMILKFSGRKYVISTCAWNGWRVNRYITI